MPRDRLQARAQNEHERSRERRISALRDLVRHRAYEVPAEDVAASIIRGVYVSGLAAARPH